MYTDHKTGGYTTMNEMMFDERNGHSRQDAGKRTQLSTTRAIRLRCKQESLVLQHDRQDHYAEQRVAARIANYAKQRDNYQQYATQENEVRNARHARRTGGEKAKKHYAHTPWFE